MPLDERELQALEDPEEWDNERAEVRPPSKAPRAVVSVAFARDDFERVAAAARGRGMKTSEFIRAAALSEATGSRERSQVLSVSGPVQSSYPRAVGVAVRAKVSFAESASVYAT